jgi:hypothetical protein
VTDTLAIMIPYAELERAIARWKARQAGHEGPVHEVGHEAVVESYSESHEHVIEGSGLISIVEDTTKA